MDHLQVYCEVGGERSEGEKTGLELSTLSLKVREDGGRESVSLQVLTAPQCGHCSLQLGLTVRNNFVGLRPPDISVWPGCQLSLDCEAGECEGDGRLELELTALQDLIDDEATVNMVEFSVWCEEDPAWASYSPPPLRVEVETVATALCHVYRDPHIITYDQARYELYSRGTFLLTSTQDGRQQVEVRLWRCGPVSCVCGLVAREDDDVVSIDMCGGEYGDTIPVVKLFNLRQEQIQTRLYEGRQGKILRAQFPSGRSVEAGLEYWGLSLSLLATGADRGKTR